jgi:hypothetical protein
LIPEAGGISRILGNAAKYRGIVADRAGYKLVDALGHTTSFGSLMNSFFETSNMGLLSTGLTIAGFVPGLGQITAGGLVILDAVKIVQAIVKCP